MLDIGITLAERHVHARIVALAVLVLVSVEIHAGLDRAKIIVERRTVATKDADRVTVAMAPVADDPAPHSVGHILLAWTQQLGVATHPFVQRVDDFAAIDRGHHRHRRIKRNLLAEMRRRGPGGTGGSGIGQARLAVMGSPARSGAGSRCCAGTSPSLCRFPSPPRKRRYS